LGEGRRNLRRTGHGHQPGTDLAGEHERLIGVTFGGDDAQLVKRRRGSPNIARHGRSTVRQQHRNTTTGTAATELDRGDTECPGEVGSAEALERQDVVDDSLTRFDRVLALGDNNVLTEGEYRIVLR
jgi:hypothetical protein